MPPLIIPEESSDESSDFSAEEKAKEAKKPEVKKPEGKAKENVKEKARAKAEEEKQRILLTESDMEETEDDDDEVGEDEYVVEAIKSHLVDEETGELIFEVKWEGYEKPSDRTWEPEENLDTASKILDEYLASVGGRESILAAWREKKEAAKKGKKRGRAGTATENTNGTKRGKKAHPKDSTPPVSAAMWKPPTGSWEDQVTMIDACEGNDNNVVVYLTWKDGQKTQHPLHQVYKRCPQKMLQFYESHLVFKKNDDHDTDD